MKTLLFLTILLLSSCHGDIDEMNEWINSHPKPIECRKHTVNGFDLSIDYTLVDSNGNLYRTGSIEMDLPDTLF